MSGSSLTSVFVPPDARAELTFLSDEYFAGRFAKASHPVSDVAAAVSEARSGPLQFIFHTAFCRSTLMARALEIPGEVVSLKEPDVLINLANRFIQADDRGNRERLNLVLKLLSRPSDDGKAVVVKPTNFANRLALPILEARPDSRAVLLYGDVETLLRSITKRGMWGRIWGRQLFANLSKWTPLDFGYDAEQTFALTDLQALGLAWLMQIRHFTAVAQAMGDQVMIVDSAEFAEKPEDTLHEVAQFFGLNIARRTIAETVAGPIFARHSKFADRNFDEAAAQGAHGTPQDEEIEMVVKWVEAVASHLGVGLKPA
jgi:hypothetical protein